MRMRCSSVLGLRKMWRDLSDEELPPVDVREKQNFTEHEWNELAKEWKRRFPELEEEIAEFRKHFPGAKVTRIELAK